MYRYITYTQLYVLIAPRPAASSARAHTAVCYWRPRPRRDGSSAWIRWHLWERAVTEVPQERLAARAP